MISDPPIAYDDWHAGGSAVAYEDHSVWWRCLGNPNQAAVVLIHGFPTCSWDWAWIADQLSRQYHLIIPDLLDYGSSIVGRGFKTTLMDQADMIEALVQTMNRRRVSIIAHDVGDTVAQELLARRIEGRLGFQIDRIAFLNGGLFPDLHRPRPMQKLLAGRFGPVIAQFTSDDKFLTSLQQVFGPDTQPSGKIGDDLVRAAMGKQGKAGLARRIQYMRERRVHANRWVDALKQPDLPMLFINGNADPVSGDHVVARIKKTVPHAGLVNLPNIGHFPQIEDPESVTAALLPFLEPASDSNLDHCG